MSAANRGLAMGPNVQQFWGWSHAIWFTLMGAGGGVFILAHALRLTDHLGSWLGLPLVDVMSFVLIGIGGIVLIAHLGRPKRIFLALLNPRTSWISRGAIADFIFLIAGTALVLPRLRLGEWLPFSWLQVENRSALLTIEALALLSAGVVIFYAGQVLAVCKSIPYWHSPLIPVQFVASSLAISMSIVMLLEVASGGRVGGLELALLCAFVLAQAACIGAHMATHRQEPAKAHSVSMLVRGRYKWLFLGGVLGSGSVAPLVLALAGLGSDELRQVLGPLTLAPCLIAGLMLRLLTLRVGVFAMPSVLVPLRGRRVGGAAKT